MPAGAAEGVHEVITDDGEDGLTVAFWICKMLGCKLLGFEGDKVPGELVCGKGVG